MRISDSQIQLVNGRIKALIDADNFYGKKLKAAGVSSISTPEDFEALPFSEKSDLRFRPVPGQIPFAGLRDLLRSRLLLLSAYASLITEHALVRTSQMRHKESEVGVPLHFTSPIRRRASAAAFCSACFLLCPVAVAITLLLSHTSTVNVLSWSGPLSPECT